MVPDSLRGNSTAAFEPHSASSRSFKFRIRGLPEAAIVRKAIAGIPNTQQQSSVSVARAHPNLSAAVLHAVFNQCLRLKGGTSTCISVCGTSIVYCRRSPKRVFSISR